LITAIKIPVIPKKIRLIDALLNQRGIQAVIQRENYSVDVASKNDLDFIVDCQLKMALETEGIELNPETVMQGVKYIFTHPDRGFYVISRNQQQQPAAVLLVLKEWSDWRNGDVWWIHSVYVSAEYRRKRLFTKMFRFLEKLAQDNNIRGLRLYVEKSNQPAQRAYSALGMRKDRYDLFEKMFVNY